MHFTDQICALLIDEVYMINLRCTLHASAKPFSQFVVVVVVVVVVVDTFYCYCSIKLSLKWSLHTLRCRAVRFEICLIFGSSNSHRVQSTERLVDLISYLSRRSDFFVDSVVGALG